VAEVLFTNFAIIFATYSLEKIWLLKSESSKIIIYEKIDLIKPEKYEDLIKDLRERTGINKITRVEIGTIDFLRDTCSLTIYYEESGNTINLAAQSEDKDDDDD